MGINYAAVAKNASKAIRAAGFECQIQYKVDRVTDIVAGTVTGGSAIQKGYCVLDNMNQTVAAMIGAQEVKAGDMAVYFEVSDFNNARTPQAQEKFFDGVAHWNIVQVAQIAPAGKPVLFILQVRK